MKILHSDFQSPPHSRPSLSDRPDIQLANYLNWLDEAARILTTTSANRDLVNFYLTEMPLIVQDARECLAIISPLADTSTNIEINE